MDQDQTQIPERESPQEQKTPQDAAENPQHVPFLLEFSFTASRILVLLVGLLVALLAWTADVAPWMIGLRAGSAMLATGLLLWALNWFMNDHALAALKAQIERTKPEEAPRNRVEKTA